MVPNIGIPNKAIGLKVLLMVSRHLNSVSVTMGWLDVELPAAFKCALRLTFTMLSFVLKRPERKPSGSALMFLATSVKLTAYFGWFLFKCAEESDCIAGLDDWGSSRWKFCCLWMSVEK